MKIHERNQLGRDISRRTYKINETAAILGVAATTVRRMISRGLLKPLRITRHLLIPAEQIEAVLKSN
ncbi:helix-turn-helix domain-containing protein [Verrucomicrobiota bacterium sgz303538]